MMENFKSFKKITPEDISLFLNGRDPQERIVNLEYSYRDDFIKVYYRNENDDKCVSSEPFYPFLWATQHACRKLCKGDRKELVALMHKYSIGCKGLETHNEDGTECEEMKNGYNVLFSANDAMSYSKFLKFFEEAGNPIYSKKDPNAKTSFTDRPESELDKRQYLTVTPQEQYMIRTGKRFFKGYDDYDQLLRLIVDLETTGLDVHNDKIEQIGVRFNRPVKYKGQYREFEKIITITGDTEEERAKNELAGIEQFIKIIYTFDPDVITAHNGEAFDWNMLIFACERLGTTMKDLSAPYFNGDFIRKSGRESVLKLGGEVESFNQTIVPGRIVTDSLHAVRRAQATDSNFLLSNLKYSTKYLGLVKPNRVYVPGDLISTIWNDFSESYAFDNKTGDWYKVTEDKPFKDGYEMKTGRYIVERYLLDDLWECDKVEYALNGTDFMMTKIIPVTYQKACTMGTATQWKLIMLAWSYENNLAIPYSQPTGKFTGGLSRLLKVGYVDNVIKLDYNSLYPSIILTWGISDKKDIMGAMLYMLEYVLTTREKYKGAKKSANKIIDKYEEKLNKGEVLTEEENDEYKQAQMEFKVNDNRQLCWKRLGNSFFGAYSSSNPMVFPHKSIDCGERTTCTGRQSLRLMISHFHDLGYEPIVGDSVTGDTPLLIKYKDSGLIDIKPIEELMDEEHVEVDELGREYDRSEKSYLVLSRNGFVEPQYFYRHETTKPIYTVTDGDMEAELTEDHSLFNEKREEIKPSQITDETKLEYYTKPIETKELVITENKDNKIVSELAKQLAIGEIDRVPTLILNASKKEHNSFLKTFNKNKKDDYVYSKTCRAGLLFLKKIKGYKRK